jgi:DNA-directed RNA polymerase subunit RPC12/RpoP
VTQKQPYVCVNCGETFDSPEELKLHENLEKQESTPQAYDCPVCHQTFESSDKLNEHGKIQHYERS